MKEGTTHLTKSKIQISNSRKSRIKNGQIVPYFKDKTKENCKGLKRISDKMIGNKKWDNQNSKKNQFKKGIIPFNKDKTKENCEQLRIVSEKMKNGGGLKARMGNKGQPSKPELFLFKLIEENYLPFLHNTRGNKWFKGITMSFNPDFINEEKKLIIELFGNYWHNLPKLIERDKERLEAYSKEGYQTLVIWDKELKEPQQVIKKIEEFITA